jgi:hypothetical protein
MISNSTSNFRMKNLGFLCYFLCIYIPGSEAGAEIFLAWLRLQQNGAAPQAPAPQHWIPECARS